MSNDLQNVYKQHSIVPQVWPGCICTTLQVVTSVTSTLLSCQMSGDLGLTLIRMLGVVK